MRITKFKLSISQITSLEKALLQHGEGHKKGLEINTSKHHKYKGKIKVITFINELSA